MDNKIATYFGLGYSEEGGSSSSSLSHLMNIMPPPPSNHFNLFNLNNQQYSKNDHQDFEISSSSNNLIKAKIMSHPHYPKLLSAYINCQKVGAPPEVVARLEEACSSSLMIARAANSSSSSTLNSDPALDQFMEAYCEMLIKYEQELSKPVKEAMIFLSTIEAQFKSLALSTTSLNQAIARLLKDGGVVGTGETERRMNGTTSEDDMECEYPIDPLAEDRELKGQLLRRYSGYLGNLKQEFMKKKKKGKLPKEARQQLLDWWTQHYKWPYPSESQKVALAESTGLDQKQINNWFINQRKRHWKPTDELQTYVVMGDASHPHYFLENNIGFANPYPFDIAPTTLI